MLLGFAPWKKLVNKFENNQIMRTKLDDLYNDILKIFLKVAKSVKKFKNLLLK